VIFQFDFVDSFSLVALMMVVVVIIVILVDLSEEDELCALLQARHSHGATHASVWVVSVEVANHPESLWRGIKDDEVLCGEAEVADYRVS